MRRRCDADSHREDPKTLDNRQNRHQADRKAIFISTNGVAGAGSAGDEADGAAASSETNEPTNVLTPYFERYHKFPFHAVGWNSKFLTALSFNTTVVIRMALIHFDLPPGNTSARLAFISGKALIEGAGVPSVLRARISASRVAFSAFSKRAFTRCLYRLLGTAVPSSSYKSPNPIPGYFQIGIIFSPRRESSIPKRSISQHGN
jgi:hypothetical protein